jgi:hypothetical protein
VNSRPPSGAHVRQSIERAAQEAMECDDPETRELAEQSIKEVRKIRFA